MRKFSKKQYLAAGAAAAIVVAGGGAAYAYWTTSGSGTGTGSVATTNGTLDLHGAIDTSGTVLAPGNTVPVHFTADNNSTSNLQAGTIHAVVSTSAANCQATWFSIPDTAENYVVDAGQSAVPLPTDGQLTFNDSTTVDQSACKGATITLTLTS